MKGFKATIAAALTVSATLLAGCEQQPAAPNDQSANAAAAGTASATAAGNEAPLVKAAADPSLQWGPCPEGLPEGCAITVLHGDPAQPNADIFLRLPGGSVVPPHTHTSAERMILVGGELEVKYQGAPAETLRAGHYAYGPAKLPHRAQCRSSEPCILFIAFREPVDLVPYEGSVD